MVGSIMNFHCILMSIRVSTS